MPGDAGNKLKRAHEMKISPGFWCVGFLRLSDIFCLLGRKITPVPLRGMKVKVKHHAPL
jgi:hypothetical protein